jgi:hypothetical protein
MVAQVQHRQVDEVLQRRATAGSAHWRIRASLIGYRADKLIDIASAGETVIYNNELIGAYTPTPRARRTAWSRRVRAAAVGFDSPRIPIAATTRHHIAERRRLPCAAGIHGGSRDERQRVVLEHGPQQLDPCGTRTRSSVVARCLLDRQGYGLRSALSDDGTLHDMR